MGEDLGRLGEDLRHLEVMLSFGERSPTYGRCVLTWTPGRPIIHAPRKESNGSDSLSTSAII